MYRVNSLLRILACGIFILVLTGVTVAQFNAGVQGSAKDSTGALVPEALVTLTNRATNQTSQVTASDQGFYRFSSLQPGEYTLKAEKEGFGTTTMNIVVRAESVQGFDIVLNLGDVAETVTITDAAEQVLQTENANIDKVITTQEVLRLPQIGRDPYELARLAPGVFGAGARNPNGSSNGLPNTSGPGGSNIGIFATENQVPISANGQRVSSNNFQIDGVSVNSQTWGGSAVITPTQEAVKEVQVTSSTYSAEDGRNSGAQIKVVSQNGTNQFHGSGFFKYNDPKWNAFNSGFTIAGSNRFVAPLRVENRDKTFGGSLGGPVIFPRFGEGGPSFYSGKNKLFFFFAYEGLRTKTNQTYERYIETTQLRQFIAGRNGISSQIINSSGAMPRVISILPRPCNADVFPNGNACANVAGGVDIGSPAGSLGRYFAGNQSVGGGLDGIPDLQYALLENPQSTDGNQYVIRFDFDATDRDKFAFSLFYSPRTSFGADTGAQSRPMADNTSERLNYNAAFSYIRNLSATVLNEARINYTKWGFDEVKSNPNANFGIPRVEIEELPTCGPLTVGF